MSVRYCPICDIAECATHRPVAASQPADPAVKADSCQRVTVKPLLWGEDTDYSSETYGGITARPMQGFRYYIKRAYGGVWKLSGSVHFGQPDYPTIEAAKAAAQADYEARILAAIDTQSVKQHFDDVAVRTFAKMMSEKMALSRAKGRSGWDDPAQCSVDHLRHLLYEHLAKGDPVDVANICMMLRHYDASTAPDPRDAVIARLVEAAEKADGYDQDCGCDSCMGITLAIAAAKGGDA